MNQLRLLALAALLVPALAAAAEHASEKTGGSQQHPDKAARALPAEGTPAAPAPAPQTPAPPPAVARLPPSRAEVQSFFTRVVRDYVRDSSENAGGAYTIHDELLDKNWKLELVRIHKKKIVDLGDGKYFACADLKEVGGRKTPVDLDFYVEHFGWGYVSVPLALVLPVVGALAAALLVWAAARNWDARWWTFAFVVWLLCTIILFSLPLRD